MAQVTFSAYTVRYANLTRYSGVLVGRVNGSIMVSAPSQFITRKDGGLTIQSRTTDTGITLTRQQLTYATFTGILPDTTTETLDLNLKS